MEENLCPHCGKPNLDDETLFCIYCGENLERAVGFLGKIRYPTPRAVIGITIAIVLLSFLLIILR
ncbi:MAG: zinc ribbon domain-containing protein [Candidatus Omnitrophota bacterium]